MLTGKRLAKALANSAHHKLAFDIELLEVKNNCSFASFFLFVSGKNKMHLDAIRAAAEDTMADKEARVFAVEGNAQSGWVVLDAGDIIMHIFHPDQRSYYNLFSLWGDCPSVPLTFTEKPPAIKKKAPPKRKKVKKESPDND